MPYGAVIRAGTTPKAGVLLTGVYFDELKKHGDGWPFSGRVFRPDPQPEHGEPALAQLIGLRDTFVANTIGG